MPEGALAVLMELERADERIGALLGDLDRLAAELDSLRADVAELEAFAARIPAERERLAREVASTRIEADAARKTFAEAGEAVRKADAENERDAQRFHVRARDRLSIAERRAAESESAAEAFERAVAEAEQQAERLQTSAAGLAAELRERPRLSGDAGRAPDPRLEGIRAWSEVARASLLVARGQLGAEREAVIRQASEIVAVSLGEPLTAMGTGDLARRVEYVLARGDA